MKGRVAKAVRRVLLVGGVVLAALGGGALWLATSDWGQRWAAAQIAAALGPSVRFAGVDLTLWPPPLSVSLDGVEILSSDGTPVIRARNVLGRVRLRALVGRPPFLARVEVDGFEVALTRASDGSVHLGGRAARRRRWHRADAGARRLVPAHRSHRRTRDPARRPRRRPTADRRHRRPPAPHPSRRAPLRYRPLGATRRRARRGIARQSRRDRDRAVSRRVRGARRRRRRHRTRCCRAAARRCPCRGTAG